MNFSNPYGRQGGNRGPGSGVPTQNFMGTAAGVLGNIAVPGLGMLLSPLARWLTSSMQHGTTGSWFSGGNKPNLNNTYGRAPVGPSENYGDVGSFLNAARNAGGENRGFEGLGAGGYDAGLAGAGVGTIGMGGSLGPASGYMGTALSGTGTLGDYHRNVWSFK